MVAGRLGSAGYSVLVLEAGGPTQRSLGGASSGAGRWTVFDVPLGWLQVLSDHRWSKEFQWNVPADPPPAVARGLGGCGIHNAMLYMRWACWLISRPAFGGGSNPPAPPCFPEDPGPQLEALGIAVPQPVSGGPQEYLKSISSGSQAEAPHAAPITRIRRPPRGLRVLGQGLEVVRRAALLPAVGGQRGNT